MSQLSDSLAQQVADAQTELSDLKATGREAWVAAHMPETGSIADITAPATLKADLEGKYSTEVARLQGTVNALQGQLGTELGREAPAKAGATLTTAPTPGSQADITNQHATDELTRQQAKDIADLQVKQQQLTNENQRLGISQATADLAAKQAKFMDDIRLAQLQGKDVTAALNQAKFDFAQQVAQSNAALKDQAQKDLLAKADETNKVNLYGHEVSQANTRAADAGATFRGATDFASKLAPMMGRDSPLAGNAMIALLQAAPMFQKMMGGAPLTPPQLSALSSIAALSDQKNIPVADAAKHYSNFLGQMAGALPGGETSTPTAAGVTSSPVTGAPQAPTSVSFAAPDAEAGP